MKPIAIIFITLLLSGCQKEKPEELFMHYTYHRNGEKYETWGTWTIPPILTGKDLVRLVDFIKRDGSKSNVVINSFRRMEKP